MMPESWDFFDQVLSVSGPGGVPYKNSTEAIEFYEQIAGNLRCCRRWSILNPCTGPIGQSGNKIPENFVQCLREKSAQEIQVSSGFLKLRSPKHNLLCYYRTKLGRLHS